MSEDDDAFGYRSLLFVPAPDAGALERALYSGADALILDLEDTVPHTQKAQARRAAIEVLRSQPRTPLVVRLNPVGTHLLLDDLTELVTAAGDQLREVVVPKVESDHDLVVVDWLLRQLEHRGGLEHGRIRLLPLVETAFGIGNLDPIARISTRTGRLSFGIADLASDLTLQWPSDGLEQLHLRSRLALSSRAAGLGQPLDSVWPRLDDRAGLRRDAEAARQLGFSGKLAIDAAQVEVINDVFSPTPEEVERAREVLAAFDEAERQGQAVVTLPTGEFIDYAFLQRAKTTLRAASRDRASRDRG